MREQYVLPSLGLKNGHLQPVLHSASYWLPTLPLVKRAPNTAHPAMDAAFFAEPTNYHGDFRVNIHAFIYRCHVHTYAC